MSSSADPADAVLIARVLAGDDRQAFAALVRRHQSPVRNLLRRLTAGQHALADDLAQETFLQAWRKLGQFRADAQFSTWLHRIATNAYLQYLRARRIELSLDEIPAIAADAVDDEVPDADLQLDMARAFAVLSPAERAALLQCYHLDMSHEEAAAALRCPIGTLKSHIARGKQKLKACLQAWELAP
ncbi:RNA polymerase sigma factor [Solimonas terrae]|uniref:RNA polymerase sigma factor n=1 Tax=Solimonas terrae TaxID=1396819 RepID=A0A6M2BNJ6_9GAMM|nr:sigma-70 family RNA polymerase sigma factor [Solimonas terrae]NGY03593.1 sigma-70 family RNA polymerase sigma factor [Solimonas terrae]